MGKYDDLKESSDSTYPGSKHSSVYSMFLRKDDETVTITGFPDCPNCEVTMNRNFFLDLWSCPKCHHSWDTESLVRRLEEKREEYKEEQHVED